MLTLTYYSCTWQDKGYFLDLGPHRKREGWEEITVATGIASAAILIIGLGYGPETSIKVLMHHGHALA